MNIMPSISKTTKSIKVFYLENEEVVQWLKKIHLAISNMVSMVNKDAERAYEVLNYGLMPGFVDELLIT